MSIFKKIFQNKTHDLPVSVDMHAHILPGIDDGAKTVEDSLVLIKGLMKVGYSHFICTPHIMGDYYRNTAETIQESYDLLQNALQKEQINVPISYAAEYYLDESFTAKLENKEKLLCLKDNYLLVETSYINKPNNFRETIFELQTQGYQVVLAHPERYTYLYQSFEKFTEIYDLGIKFQINLNSICGYYSPAAKKFTQRLIDSKMVDFIGTDIHHEKHLGVLEKVMKEKSFAKLASLNLLNNSLA